MRTKQTWSLMLVSMLVSGGLVAGCGNKKDGGDDGSTSGTAKSGGGILGGSGSSSGASSIMSLVPSLAITPVTGSSSTGAALTGEAVTETEDEKQLDAEDPAKAVKALDAVFANANSIRGCLAGLGRHARLARNANCYGPSVVTKNHPDSTKPEDDNPFLPSGDLGVVDAAVEGTGEACIAAKMSQLANNVGDRVKHAIETGKRVLCFARVLDLALPTVEGEELDMTSDVTAALAPEAAEITKRGGKLAFSAIKIKLVKAADTGAVYQTEVQATLPNGTMWTRSVIERVDDTHSNGYVWGVFDRSEPAAALQAGPAPAETNVFSVIFDKSGDALKYDATKSVAQSDADKAALAADKTALFDTDRRVRVATEGNPGYDHLVASVDTASGIGEMVYRWTAGSQNEEQRTMHAKTEIGDDGIKAGWGYFGYGDTLATVRPQIKDGTLADTAQSISKMICNWAGPSNSHAGVAAVQKQLFKMDAGVYKPTENHIGFAAQNTCGETGYDATYVFAKGNNASDVTDADYKAWPTYDLVSIADGSTDLDNLKSFKSLLVDTDL